MRHRTALLLAVAAAVGAGASSIAGRPLRLLPIETRIVAPLADPALLPGVSSCTSDGVCVVTDESGTRPGTALELRP